MSITITFRPLGRWPYPDTKRRRSYNVFSAGWDNTLSPLEIASVHRLLEPNE